MDNNNELLQALDGIRHELQTLNKTLSGLAAQQNRPAPRASFSDSPTRSGPPARRPSTGPGRPSAGPGRTGGYKRKSDDDGEPTGYGAEMSSRFPQKRSPARSKGKPAAKKGSGYPKKPR